jgi:hypothetical protein
MYVINILYIYTRTTNGRTTKKSRTTLRAFALFVAFPFVPYFFGKIAIAEK